MLKNGNILIFDNGSGRGWSRIIEVNPIGKEIVWEYHAEPKESFITRYWGSAQGLPNGNILICESEFDHIFENYASGRNSMELYQPILKNNGRRLHISRL